MGLGKVTWKVREGDNHKLGERGRERFEGECGDTNGVQC